MDHAKLSPSSSSRWINCPGSIKLSENVPDESSDYAREGSLAHDIAEIKLLLRFGRITEREYNARHTTATKSKYYGDEMEFYTDSYVEFCLGHGDGMFHWFERKFDLGHIVPESFGTSDYGLYNADARTLWVTDLKYGRGVVVDPEWNSQGMLYALGAAREAEFFGEVETVNISIFQPRVDNVKTWSVPYSDLAAWALETVAPAVDEIGKPDATIAAGEWCKFCPVKSTCKVRAEKALFDVKAAFARAGLYDVPELIDAYRQGKLLSSWLSDAENILYDLALKGAELPGLKLVDGVSRRRWEDPDAALAALKRLRIKKADRVNEKIKSIKDIKNTMSADKFEKHLQQFVGNTNPKPRLVDETEPSLQWGLTAAKSAFATNNLNL